MTKLLASISLPTVMIIVATIPVNIFAAGSDPKSEALKVAVERVSTLSNITIEYSSILENEVLPPAEVQEREKDHITFHKGVVEQTQNVFRFHNNNARFETKPDDNVLKQAMASGDALVAKDIICICPSRIEEISWQLTQNAPAGVIRTDPQNIFLSTVMIDIGLGLRTCGSYNWQITKYLTEENSTLSSNGVLDVIAKGPYTHHWRFDPNLGYGLSEYELIGPKSRILYSCSDFKNVNGIFVPFTIVRKIQIGPELKTFQSQILKISKFIIGDPSNIDNNTFMIAWPKRSHILDMRVGKTFETGEKDSTLTDDQIVELFTKQEKNIEKIRNEAEQLLKDATGATTQP